MSQYYTARVPPYAVRCPHAATLKLQLSFQQRNSCASPHPKDRTNFQLPHALQLSVADTITIDDQTAWLAGVVVRVMLLQQLLHSRNEIMFADGLIASLISGLLPHLMTVPTAASGKVSNYSLLL